MGKKTRKPNGKPARLDTSPLDALRPTKEQLEDINRRGLQAVIRELGPSDAMSFFMFTNPGKGDYVRDRDKLTPKRTLAQLKRHVARVSKQFP
jgi:hypothetical protein